MSLGPRHPASFAAALCLFTVSCIAQQTEPSAPAAAAVSGQLASAHAPATPLPSRGSPASPAPAFPLPPPASLPVPAGGLPSLFDWSSTALLHPVTTIRVGATTGPLSLTDSAPLYATAADIILSAGTFGDISRFLQTFPGVTAAGDTSNQFLVRGGHPIENLFLIDGIVSPNLNHLGTASSTGGFAPLVDAAAIQGLEFDPGTPDARFPERLSSRIEIHTLEIPEGASPLEADLGIEGVGGLATRRLGPGDLLLSAHHGLLNLFTRDIGLNGVPGYTNLLARYLRKDRTGDHFELLSIAGWDSLSVVPCASDVDESSTIQSSYSGWRQTSGLSWQHLFGPESLGVLRLSDSEQVGRIRQQDQLANPLQVVNPRTACPIAPSLVPTIPVYTQDSNSAVSSAAYDYSLLRSRFNFAAGSSLWLQRPNYDVQQPIGSFSPYSANPARSDATTFHTDSALGETGTYLQLSASPTRSLGFSAGARVQTFAFHSHTTVTPRATLRYRLAESLLVHAGYARYAQLPPYILLDAFPQNAQLAPMRAEHFSVGAEFRPASSTALRLEAYRKNYRDVPASTEYPSVSFENQIDMLGDPITWLPMSSAGTGRALGLELSSDTRLSKLHLNGSVAYARARFAGLDAILRPGNFDLPWSANMNVAWALRHTLTLSSRVSYTTGRPYTPFDLPASIAQNRPIYDLAEINTHRALDYLRVDLQASQQLHVGRTRMYLYGGLDNALNRPNFLSYVWLSRAGSDRNPVGTLTQMPIFPSVGLRALFR